MYEDLKTEKVLKGRYLISKEGKIFDQMKNKYVSKIQNSNRTDGYTCTVNLKGEKEKSYVYRYVHKLVALTFVPNPENKKYVGFKDGDKSNIAADNLFWTNNKRSKSLNGIHSRSTITLEEVKALFMDFSEGLSRKEISIKYKRTQSWVGKVLNRDIHSQVIIDPNILEKVEKRLTKVSDEDIKEMLRLVDSGFTYAQIAEHTGIPKGSVRYYLYKE